MAFRDFRFPQVRTDLGLSYVEASLFADVPSLALSDAFSERMREDVALALAIDTEKARSEFIVAAVLSELRRTLKGRFGLFSGVEFNVDPARGLNGFCDFLMTRSPFQAVLTAPVLAIAEAKNENVRNGLGQCVSAMVAARDFNAGAGGPVVVHGAVTTGAVWKFLRLSGDLLTLDVDDYFVSDLGRVMGVLAHVLTSEDAQ